MGTRTWTRAYEQASTSTGVTDTLTVELSTWDSQPLTLVRIIVDWDQLLSQGTLEGILSYSVPTAVALALTTAPSGMVPPAPATGPVSNPAGPWLWWEGAPWRPIGPYGSTGAIYGSEGRIDRQVNTELDSALASTLWLVGETHDSSANFDDHYLAAYAQILHQVTGS